MHTVATCLYCVVILTAIHLACVNSSILTMTINPAHSNWNVSVIVHAWWTSTFGAMSSLASTSWFPKVSNLFNAGQPFCAHHASRKTYPGQAVKIGAIYNNYCFTYSTIWSLALAVTYCNLECWLQLDWPMCQLHHIMYIWCLSYVQIIIAMWTIMATVQIK